MSLQVLKNDQNILWEDIVTPGVEFSEKRPTKYMVVSSCLDKDRNTLIRRQIKLLLVDHFHDKGFEYKKQIEEEEEEEKREIKNSIVGFDGLIEEEKP